LGIKPKCELCPNKGGAMKATKSGQKWAHVSCALWIPEVSIGCVEKMEPITKISKIPQSRWNLVCVLCKERVGSCIQCSVKTCKVAYHVTCAFKRGLEMRAIIEDENADDGVKLRVRPISVTLYFPKLFQFRFLFMRVKDFCEFALYLFVQKIYLPLNFNNNWNGSLTHFAHSCSCFKGRVVFIIVIRFIDLKKVF
jgi:hypothetical protein